MKYTPPCVEARFLRRYKRFLVDVELDGEQVTVHCANTGSMRGCMEEGAPVRLSYHPGKGRKLPWSLEQIQVGGRWILVNTARPNQVVAEALAAGRVPELAGYARIERERPMGEGSRVDLLCSDGIDGRPAWVEVKNVTLVEDDVARFPDAVTARGTRHLKELAARAALGDRAVLFLHVGHEGGSVFEPAADIDPVWAETLAEGVQQGVEVLAYRCVLGPDALFLGEPVPVTIPGR